MELQIVQTRHPLSLEKYRKMYKFNTPQNEKIFKKVHETRDANLQCMNNHYTKFEKRNKNFLSYILHRIGTPKVLRKDGQSDRKKHFLDTYRLSGFRCQSS